jgi:hypothetical protein
MGIEVRSGDPRENKPGERIVIPEHPAQLAVVDVDLDHLRRSYLRNAANFLSEQPSLAQADYEFLAVETRWSVDDVKEIFHEMRRQAR